MSGTIHLVGTTHFDPVWLWRWDEGMASIRSTFRSALDRMSEEPLFVYSFSCPPVFEWIRAVDPELFEEIRRKVREGRWHLVEGWWLQPDCNVASGESYARHGLYGQRYLERTFGRRSRGGFNTDSFGHSAMLPQILAKSGIEHYVFGRPSPRELELPGPLFVWESPDGSSVLAYRSGGDGANAYSPEVDASARAAAPLMGRLGHDLMLIYGVSDHGGAPTREAIARIRALMADGDKGFDATFSTPERFFGAQARSALPVHRGELAVRDFGVFSNHSDVKSRNRRVEYALLDAERAALLATIMLATAYPKDKLTAAWQDLLFNQFHDIVGGASIRDAYPDARDLHGRAHQSAREVLHYSLQSITRTVDTSGAGYPLVVWNLNPFAVHMPLEAELQWAWELDWYRGPLSVLDADGTPIPCQLIQERSVLPGFRSRFVLRPRLEALSYRTFRVLQREPSPLPPAARRAGDLLMDSGRLHVELSPESGCIRSVSDSVGRMLLREGARAVARADQGDTWAFNVDGYGEELEPFRLESARLVENGPVRALIRTRARFRESVLEQDLLFYAGTDSIEGRFRVSWRERHTVLKLRFDTGLSSPVLTSSIPYGALRRPMDGREMPTGEWLDLSSAERGVSIVSDSIFAYDATGARVDLTVLRSPIHGHLTWKDPIDPGADYEYLEQGVREGSWRVLFHGGSGPESFLPREAAAFNNPPITIDEAAHPGGMPGSRSFLRFEAASCMITAIKQAEDGDDVIVRLCEYAGRPDLVRLALVPPGLECRLECAPHEIRTIRFGTGSGGSVRDVSILEE